MNENLDLCEILKGCPKGTKLWSPVWGDVFLVEIKEKTPGTPIMPIAIKAFLWDSIFLSSNGKLADTEESECVIFPSKDQRDWSKFKRLRFDPKDFKPFDKVLVKGLGCNSKVWAPCFLEEFKKFSDGSGAVVLIGFISFIWQRCIPYNDETMHLVNTEKDCPDYYKWWEDLCQK